MKSLVKATALTLAAGAVAAGAAHAGVVLVTSNITTSETWTADNTYNLRAQVFVAATAQHLRQRDAFLREARDAPMPAIHN